MATYPGGKNGSGAYQAIINLMPPHRIYVEGFFGSGAVMRMKRPAEVANIAIDVDGDVIERIKGQPALYHLPGFELWPVDFLTWPRNDFRSKAKDTRIYLDPPYLMSSRSSQRPIYRHELSDEDHQALLETIQGLGCMVMISGYRSALYDRELAGWRREEYPAMTRGGRVVTECVWCNFPVPLELHDYRYLGRGFRERERIKRKVKRWKAKLKAQPALERSALLQAIQELREEMSQGSTIPPELAMLPADIATTKTARAPG